MLTLQQHFNNLPYSFRHSSARDCIEKRMAITLVLGGIQTLKPTHSYCHGHNNELDSLLISNNSLIAKPYIPFTYDTIINDKKRKEKGNLFWAVLRKCNISYSGGANFDNPKLSSYAQASWLAKSQKDKHIDHLTLVAYFNEIKELYDNKLLID